MASDPTLTRVGRSGPDRAAWIVLLAALPAVAALVLWLDRGTTYNVDQIRFFLSTPGAGLGDLFEPQNGNLLVTTTLLFKVSLNVFGALFLPFRLVHVVVLLATCAVFFALIKKRVGPLPALVATLILLVFGSDWGHVGTALGFTVLSSVGAGLAAMLFVERRDRAGDIGACAMLTLSIASFSTGLAFLVGVALNVLLERDRWRRAWVFAIPLVLYLAWWWWARGSDSPALPPQAENLLLMPNYSFVSLAAVLSSLGGLNYDFSVEGTPTIALGPGMALAVLAALALVVRMSRGRLPVAFWVALGTLLCYWTLGSLVTDPEAGIRIPTKTRYMFPGAVMVLLVAAALVDRGRPTRPVAAALIAFAVTGLLTNLALLRDGAAWFRNEFSAPARAQFTMLDLARDRVADDYEPRFAEPNYSVINTPARVYLNAAAEFGSPGFTLDELQRQPDAVRVAADHLLAGALRLGLKPLPGGARAPTCVPRTRSHGSVSAEVPNGGGRLLIRTDVTAPVTLGRFADQPSVQIGDAPAGVWTRLSIPGDDAEQPWRLQIAEPTGAAVCLESGRAD